MKFGVNMYFANRNNVFECQDHRSKVKVTRRTNF